MTSTQSGSRSRISLIGETNKVQLMAEFAVRRLKEHAQQQNRAVVFDIDDTVLFGTAKKQKIHPVLVDIYKTAIQLGYAVFFITARIDQPGAREYTVKQLQANELGQFNDLFLMPVEYMLGENFSPYKARVRQHLAQQGHNIVLNLGDNWSDLMLLPPYIKGAGARAVQNFIQAHSDKQFIAFEPLDVSYLAIKFPYGCQLLRRKGSHPQPCPHIQDAH